MKLFTLVPSREIGDGSIDFQEYRKPESRVQVWGVAMSNAPPHKPRNQLGFCIGRLTP